MELREIQTSDDPRDHPIVVLEEKNGDRRFPIFIGPMEARALDESVVGHGKGYEIIRRPMSHDLMLNIIDGLGAELKRLLIPKLEAGTFYGLLELSNAKGELVHIDTRPSDGLVVAMKRKVPIFVEEMVLKEVDATDESED
jgi:bifunctional DNase/RNase